MRVGIVAEAVAQGREYGHDTAEACIAAGSVGALQTLTLALNDVPFMRVMRSARCMARTREKCPSSADSSIFCLSTASFTRQSLILAQSTLGKRTGLVRAGAVLGARGYGTASLRHCGGQLR